MGYQVSFIGERDLPAGVDWAAVRIGELCYLFVKLSAALSALPADAIRAIRRLAGIPVAA